MCHFEILPFLLQSVVKVLSDPSRFYSWYQKQLKTALLTDVSADLDPGDLFRLSQANITRIRVRSQGLPWRSSGYRPCYHCKWGGFQPWSGENMFSLELNKNENTTYQLKII